MPDQSGRKIAVGIAKESTRGTAATAALWLSQTDLDFYERTEKAELDGVLGVLNDVSGMAPVKAWADGSIGGKAGDKSIGYLILAALGSVSSVAQSAPNTSVYDHTITQSQVNNPTTLTLTRKDGNSDKQFSLATLKKLEINVAVGEFVTYSAEFVAKKGTTTASTVAYTAENTFRAKDASLKLAANTAGLGAATAVPVKSFKLTIERDVSDEYVLGSNDLNDLLVTGFRTVGEFVLRYSDTTYETLYLNDTVQAMQLYVVNSGVTIGSSANPAFKFTWPTVKLNQWNIKQDIGGVTEQTAGFRGMYDLATSKEVDCVLTNLQTSY